MKCSSLAELNISKTIPQSVHSWQQQVIQFSTVDFICIVSDPIPLLCAGKHGAQLIREHGPSSLWYLHRRSVKRSVSQDSYSRDKIAERSRCLRGLEY